MGERILDFSDGFTSASDPGQGSGVGAIVTGSLGSPSAITAAGGVTPSDKRNEIMFIESDGGAVDVTANPQVAAGTVVGDMLLLWGSSNTNTVTFDDGNGLELNGSIVLESGSKLSLIWDGTQWSEFSRFG